MPTAAHQRKLPHGGHGRAHRDGLLSDGESTTIFEEAEHA
jgi:hypothetical protein